MKFSFNKNRPIIYGCIVFVLAVSFITLYPPGVQIKDKKIACINQKCSLEVLLHNNTADLKSGDLDIRFSRLASPETNIGVTAEGYFKVFLQKTLSYSLQPGETKLIKAPYSHPVYNPVININVVSDENA